jgi:hypothetical protein
MQRYIIFFITVNAPILYNWHLVGYTEKNKLTMHRPINVKIIGLEALTKD